MMRAMPTASLRSLLLICIFRAAFACRASMQITGSPILFSSVHIRGIGFKTADAIAMKLGIETTAMVRVRAGISYALSEAMDEGHCGLPTGELVPLTEKLLEVPGSSLYRTERERGWRP